MLSKIKEKIQDVQEEEEEEEMKGIKEEVDGLQQKYDKMAKSCDELQQNLAVLTWGEDLEKSGSASRETSEDIQLPLAVQSVRREFSRCVWKTIPFLQRSMEKHLGSPT